MTKFETNIQIAQTMLVIYVVCSASLAQAQDAKQQDAPSVKMTADFWRAIKKPDATKVRELLGRDPRLAQAREKEHGNTALHIAPTVEIADALLSAGADLEALDTAHFATPLRWAAGEKRWGVVKFLKEQGAKVTDIYLACAIGDVDHIKAFLKHDPKLLEAPALRCDYLAEREHAMEATRNQAGHTTPIMIAVSASQAQVVKTLIDEGADPNATNEEGTTLLHLAAWNADPDVITTLVKAGAHLDVEEPDHHNTPLGWAIVSGKVENVKALLAAGAKIRPDFANMAESGRKGEFNFSKSKPQDYEQIAQLLRDAATRKNNETTDERR
jgi:ankyrin repeat protein